MADTRDGNTVRVELGKSISASDVGELKQRFKDYVADGVTTLVLDCSDVEIIDSIGIGLLVATHNSLAGAGGSLELENATDDIYNLLSTMRLDKHFTIRRA